MLNMLKKRWWLIFVLGLIGIGIWKIAFKPKPILATINPKVQPIAESLQVSGFIDAEERADIPYGTGRVSWVGVKNQQTVKKWQSLAQMDTQTLEKQLQSDLNTFNKQWRAHDQTIDDNKYYDRSDISATVKRLVENANFDLQNAALQVEIRDLAIKMSTISSPIDGIITRLDKPFSGVFSNSVDTIQVVNPNTIYFAAVVDETDIAKVSEGQKVLVELDAFPNQKIDSTIQKIEYNPSTNKSGGTGYKIHIPLTDRQLVSKLRLGMNGTVTIILQSKPEVLTIPIDSVISQNGKSYVDVKHGDKITRQEITTGIETDTDIEVTSGLQTNDAVVLPSKGK